MKYISSSEKLYDLIIAGYHLSLDSSLIIKTVNSGSPTNESYMLFEVSEVEFTNIQNIGEVDKIANAYFKSNTDIKLLSATLFKGQEEVVEIGNRIRIVVFEPNKNGYITEIENTPEDYKKIVEGPFEFSYLQREDMVVVNNEMGKLLDLPYDRGLYGTFFIVGLQDNQKVSLSDELIKEIFVEFDDEAKVECKNQYLQTYFQEKWPKPRQFKYELEDDYVFINTDNIIEFMLNEKEEFTLSVIEKEIRKIEEKKLDIYSYLNLIGIQIIRYQEAMQG